VAGHFPVYSGGEHGNTKELVKDLKPLLEKYKVRGLYGSSEEWPLRWC
jgi:hypothetical protein